MSPDDIRLGRETRHRVKLTAVYTAALLLGLAAGVAVTVADARDMPSWVFTAIAATVFASGFALTLYWWRQIDEAARAAHLEAFFWGGLAGLTAASTLAVAALRWNSVPFDAAATPSEAFAHGVLATFLAATLGYAAAWVVWWLRRR